MESWNAFFQQHQTVPAITTALFVANPKVGTYLLISFWALVALQVLFAVLPVIAFTQLRYLWQSGIFSHFFFLVVPAKLAVMYYWWSTVLQKILLAWIGPATLTTAYPTTDFRLVSIARVAEIVHPGDFYVIWAIWALVLSLVPVALFKLVRPVLWPYLDWLRNTLDAIAEQRERRKYIPRDEIRHEELSVDLTQYRDPAVRQRFFQLYQRYSRTSFTWEAFLALVFFGHRPYRTKAAFRYLTQEMYRRWRALATEKGDLNDVA